MAERKSDKGHKSGESSKSKSKSKSKSQSKTSSDSTKRDDWSDITDRDERRRTQNRIAQRKFREKAKESKETKEREERDQEHAGGAYSHADPEDMGTDNELSGLPWGSLSLKHVVKTGKQRQSASGRESAEQAYDQDAYNYYDTYDYYSGSGSGQGGGSY